jgi:hypothetical protein
VFCRERLHPGLINVAEAHQFEFWVLQNIFAVRSRDVAATDDCNVQGKPPRADESE